MAKKTVQNADPARICRQGPGEKEFKIGRLAELAGCQVVTIRYYEREGLLGKPARGDNGYRLYADDDLDRLMFIRHCRDHGIPLADIKELLKLRRAPEVGCGLVDDMLDGLIGKLEQQIRSIRKLRKNLVALRGRCQGHTTIGECAILKTLSDRKDCPCAADEKASSPRAARSLHGEARPAAGLS